jgi:protein ImuA
MSVSPQHADRLAALRAEVRKIEGLAGTGTGGFMPLGVEEVDARLAGGGLAETALHEVAAASPDMGNDAAATLFLAGLAGRKSAADPRGQVLWALTRHDLFAPGLAQAGLPPDRLLYAECCDDDEVLAVMEEGLRHGGLAAVIGEVGRCAMAAARRLQLAAEEGGTMALLFRRWKKAGRDPLAEVSPAVTRWRIASAPSAPLPFEGIGRARFSAELARQRGGAPQQWILEAPDAQACFALPAAIGDRTDLAEGEYRAA